MINLEIHLKKVLNWIEILISQRFQFYWERFVVIGSLQESWVYHHLYKITINDSLSLPALVSKMVRFHVVTKSELTKLSIAQNLTINYIYVRSGLWERVVVIESLQESWVYHHKLKYLNFI